MQNDNLSTHEELRQMKSDYEYLKAGMDRQAIISGKLMETVFRNKTGKLDSNRKTTLSGLGAAVLITLAASYIRGVDMYLAGMIAAFFLLLLIAYVIIYHKLGKIEYGTDDVFSTVTRLRRFKRNYMVVNIVSWILVAGLMFFIFPEIRSTFSSPERGIAAVAFMCVAILAGICTQYFIDRKVLRACDDIIDHLEDRS